MQITTELRERITENDTIQIFFNKINDHPIISVASLLILFVLITGNYSLAMSILVFGLFAMGYNILLGETGMVTFGHAAFFGLGAYGFTFYMKYLEPPEVLGIFGLFTGIALAALAGAIIGAISLKRGGTYLALITLAFAQMIYFTFFQWKSVTGGDNGLFGIPAIEIGLPGMSISLSTTPRIFVFSLLLLVISLYLINRLQQTHFGKVLNGIRENEERIRYLGYNVYQYKIASFVVSAIFSGLAGALYSLNLRFVNLNTLEWVLSGEVNFYAFIGGVGTFVGPIIGSGAYVILTDTATRSVQFWELPVGLLLIAGVLLFPEGIVGGAKKSLLKE